MQTLILQVDDSLFSEVTKAALALGMPFEEFARIALEMALQNQRRVALEKKHADGYAKKPMSPEEIGFDSLG